MTCRFLGFEPKTLKAVQVEAGQTTTVDFALTRSEVPPRFPGEEPQKKGKEGGFISYDVPPKPVGGLAAIQQNLKKPASVQSGRVKGTVLVQIKIDTRGNVVETRIVKSLSPECDQAAIEAIKKTKWEPARYKTEPVPVWVTIPVRFQ